MLLFLKKNKEAFILERIEWRGRDKKKVGVERAQTEGRALETSLHLLGVEGRVPS